jgi:septum site-determining protein MinC
VTAAESIIPDQELNSVLEYLKANSDSEDGKTPAANSEEKSKTETLATTSAANSEEKSKTETPATTTPTNLDVESEIELELPEPTINNRVQVQLKTTEGKLFLIFPTESELSATDFSWGEICHQMKQRLNAGSRLRTPNTPIHLVAQDRLLDSRQLQELAESLNEYQLQLKSVATSRRQTAIAAVTAGYSVEQLQAHNSFTGTVNTTSPLADALYLEMTIRSGVEIRHPGTVVVLGDINPGGIIVADGDILVWGRLRGVAHAGAKGNKECVIMALQMEPTQLRIADAVARSPEKLPSQFFPEVAHITPQGIRIAKATDFSRSQLSKINQEL